MNTLMTEAVNASLVLGAGGLSGAWQNIVTDWLGPIMIAIITVVAITLLIRKQIAGFITFALVAVVAAVLVFNAEALFGEKGGLTQVGSKLATEATGATNSIDSITLDSPYVLDLK